MGLNGVEIFTNSSGSHHELRKLQTRINLIVEATRQAGGIYLYANQQGCDGDRLYYDGCAMIIVNGQVVAQGSQFSLNDVEIITATVDLEEVRSFRCSPSRGLQASKAAPYHRIELDHRLTSQDPHDPTIGSSPAIELRYHLPAEEIALGPACWLWDYLRRCGGAAGFFIPLSGGIDSCATSVIVFSMCRLVYSAITNDHNPQVITDCRRLCGESSDSLWLPSDPQEICNRVFHTCFMGTTNSSGDTRSRARALASEIGAYHTDLNIDSVISALTSMFTAVTSFTPRFKVHGGSPVENLALQNIQARLRMVTAYLFAQLLPTVRKRPGGGSLLVLGSANVDESLRGYLTKYDCSSADINPIGGISKTDLKSFIAWAQTNFDLPILKDFIDAVPTAELEPITATYVQSDEADMGMTYDELSVFGRLRKVSKLGPWGMYEKLVHAWGAPPPPPPPEDLSSNISSSLTTHPSHPSTSPTEVSAPSQAKATAVQTGQIPGRGLSPREIYDKVRRFFYYYSINRHKMTVLTPSYHAEQYSPDDNRFDLRPFLYPSFSWPYRKMMDAVEAWEEREKEGEFAGTGTGVAGGRRKSVKRD